jgi:hypothetical protein
MTERHKAKAGHSGRLCCVDELTIHCALRRRAMEPTRPRPAGIKPWISVAGSGFGEQLSSSPPGFSA